MLGLGSDGGGIAVRLSAKTSDFTAGLNRAQDELTDMRTKSMQAAASLGWFGESADEARDDAVGLSIAMQALQGRTDEAGEELQETGTQSLFTSGSFAALTASTDGLSVSMIGLRMAIAPLIVSMLTLLTIVAPLAAAFGVLVAMLGSVAGLGIGLTLLTAANHAKALKTALKSATDAFMGIIKPITKEFLPALLWVINSLPALAKEIRAVLLPHIEELAWWFSELALTAMSAIPGIIRVMVRLAKRAFPLVRSAMQWLMANGPSTLRRMEAATRKLMPAFRDFGKAMQEFLPVLLKFGTVTATVVLPILADLFRLSTAFMQTVTGLPAPIQKVTIAFLALIGPVALLFAALAPLVSTIGGIVSAVGGMSAVLSGLATVVGVVVGALSGPLLVVIALLGVLASAWLNNWMGIRDTTKEIVGDIMGWLGGLLDMVDKVISGLQKVAQKHPDNPQNGRSFNSALGMGMGATSTNKNQKVGVEVAVTSDDEKFRAEVKELSGEVVETKQRQVRRLSRARNNRG